MVIDKQDYVNKKITIFKGKIRLQVCLLGLCGAPWLYDYYDHNTVYLNPVYKKVVPEELSQPKAVIKKPAKFPLNSWSDKVLLIKNGGAEIYVQFKVKSNNCSSNTYNAKFKYTSKFVKSNNNKSLRWSFDFIDCYGNTSKYVSVIDLKDLYTGSYMSADDMISCKKILTLPYGIVLL